MPPLYRCCSSAVGRPASSASLTSLPGIWQGIQHTVLGVQGLLFMVWGSEDWGLGFRVRGLITKRAEIKIRMEGFGFRASGVGCEVKGVP